MDQKQLDILNLMARLDQEAPFLDEGVESSSAVEFDSIEDATAVFESTLAMRDSIKIQAAANQIPEAWIERIQNFSDESTREPAPSLGSLLSTWLESTRDSIFGQPQYWGAGLVTASVLAIMFNPFGGQVDGPGLGGGMQSPALPGSVGGTAVMSASLSTEKNQESGSESSNDLSELTATGEMKGLSIPTEDSLKNYVGCDNTSEVRSTEAQESEQPERCPDALSEESP